MTHEDIPQSNPENASEATQDVYYISETGSLWSPMVEAGVIRDFEGNVTKYILGDPRNPAKTIEVPADWFDQHKDELRIPEDGKWSMVGKPTLETPVSAQSGISPVGEPKVEQIKLATVALGSTEASKEDPKAEIARLDSELKQLYGSFSEDDGRAVWQYAASVSDEERARKSRYISEDVRQSGLHLKYWGLFEKLREARKRAERS